MKKFKVFDCSINSFAPGHRSISLGPKENDMMADLKKYANGFDIVYVENFKKADRIITNTTYTPEILSHAKINRIPLIKRMDGVFWRKDLIERNKLLNEAAQQSDAVIFISKFSQKSFHDLYPELTLKNEFVVLNAVDDDIFYPTKPRNQIIGLWGASCTNWERDEKRPDDLLRFADLVGQYGEKILVFGKSNFQHSHIINAGYFDNYNELAKTINTVDAWVNFSYRDAAPKTVLQAMACGKPVLYADSGGLPELVGDYGVSIKDKQEITFDDGNFKLDWDNVKDAYFEFKKRYMENSIKPVFRLRYKFTLQNYVDIIKETKKCSTGLKKPLKSLGS